MSDLLAVKNDARDNSWEVDFLNTFANEKVEVLSEDPQPGPDGFPYLFVRTSATASEPVQKIVEWLATRGIGLAVNPQSDNPDYVFTYGMLWNFKEKKRFLEPIAHTRSTRMEIPDGKKLFYGNLSDEFFPPYARKLLREFFNQQGIINPKVLAISTDKKDFDICFSLNALGNPVTSEHQGIAEAISWFFPFNTSIVLIEEKNLPDFYAV